jgi:hypothetical protein
MLKYDLVGTSLPISFDSYSYDILIKIFFFSVLLRRLRLNDLYYRTTFQRFHRQRRHRQTLRIVIHLELR